MPEGQVAPVGAVLVVIGDEGEQLLRSVETEPAEPSAPELVVAALPPEPLAAVRATPLVRRLAQELGVDLAAIEGSGPGGRVTEDDVRAIGATAVEGSASAFAPEGRREAVRGIRRLIVEHVSTSHREIPAVTYLEECDFTDVDRIAARCARPAGDRAVGLREFPELNARLEGDEIVYLDRYDLGLAVQTDQGSSFRWSGAATALTLDELAAEAGRLADGRARRLAAPRGAPRVDVHGHERGEARRPRRHAVDQPSRGRHSRYPPHRAASRRSRGRDRGA